MDTLVSLIWFAGWLIGIFLAAMTNFVLLRVDELERNHRSSSWASMALFSTSLVYLWNPLRGLRVKNRLWRSRLIHAPHKHGEAGEF